MLPIFQAGHEGSIPFARSYVMSQDIEDTRTYDLGSGFRVLRGGLGVPGGGPLGLPVGW